MNCSHCGKITVWKCDEIALSCSRGVVGTFAGRSDAPLEELPSLSSGVFRFEILLSSLLCPKVCRATRLLGTRIDIDESLFDPSLASTRLLLSPVAS